jgi:chemotaxis protein MotA
MLKWVFLPPEDRYRMTVRDIELWSATARREGLLSLQRYFQSIRDPFTAKGLRLIVDGVDPFKLRHILEVDLSVFEIRERQAARIWEIAGGYSPTIGIVGAVLGLIHVMENLSDPSSEPRLLTRHYFRFSHLTATISIYILCRTGEVLFSQAVAGHSG